MYSSWLAIGQRNGTNFFMLSKLRVCMSAHFYRQISEYDGCHHTLICACKNVSQVNFPLDLIRRVIKSRFSRL